MATTISFQKKVRKKVEDKEENNNDESLVCDICSVVCKSNANLKKHKLDFILYEMEFCMVCFNGI